MKTILAIFVFSALLLITCSKDKFESKPRLEFKDYNRIVDSAGTLRFRITFYDKEGDLDGAPFTAIINELNNFPPPPNVLADTFRYNLPEFPKKDKAEINFQLDYSRLDESTTQSDTVRFRFAVTDNEGNNSDTITSDIIIARKP